MDAETQPEQIQASLVTLPVELALRIAAVLDPQSLVRLSLTCTSLHEIARTESLWRSIVLELVAAHGQAEVSAGTSRSAARSDVAPAATSWYEQARFLLPHSPHLGYFVSSTPYTSRIIRVSITTPSLSAAADAPPPSYTVRGAQLHPENVYANPRRPRPAGLMPFGSFRDGLRSASIWVDHHLNFDHPYSGLSVDLLEPECLEAPIAMFEFVIEDDPALSRCDPSTPQQLFRSATSTRGGLRLDLEPVTQRVERNSAATHPNGAFGTEPDPTIDRLIELLGGQLPQRQWPTLALVGLEEVNTADIPVLRGGRTDPPRSVIRLAGGGGGAFRGLAEFLTERAGERPLATVVEPDPSARGKDDEAFVTGFRLRAVRSPRTPNSSVRTGRDIPEASTSASDHEQSANTTRRRGVGQNGGPAVLWHGREEDPDDAPHVTILRAGEEVEGGFVLHLPSSPPQPRAPDLPADDNDAHAPEPAATTVDGAGTPADAAAALREAFFPIKAPVRPLSWDDPSPLDEHGEVFASSLEGLWVGTYGPHGLEFLHLTTGFVEIPADEADDTEDEEEEYASSDSEAMGRRVVYRRVVTATKVTGDANVPSGQTSWVAILPRTSRHAHPLTATVPSVPLSTFRHLSSLDPSSPAYHALNNGAGPDWARGTAHGWGRIAMTGFESPSWTPAQLRFLRHEVVLTRGGERGEDTETRTVESVEEIHLRWEDLAKVSTYRRVRI